MKKIKVLIRSHTALRLRSRRLIDRREFGEIANSAEFGLDEIGSVALQAVCRWFGPDSNRTEVRR